MFRGILDDCKGFTIYIYLYVKGDGSSLDMYYGSNVSRILVGYGHASVSEASLGPFPWDVQGQVTSAPAHARVARSPRTLDIEAKWVGRLDKDVLLLPRTDDVFRKIEKDPSLSYRLPRPGATAGVVIQHAAAVFEGLHLHHKPMTFKFGFSHCAYFRWNNSKFGYKYEANRFERMVVVYAAADPVGPAFLEAALIQRYEGYLPQGVCMYFGKQLVWNLSVTI